MIFYKSEIFNVSIDNHLFIHGEIIFVISRNPSIYEILNINAMNLYSEESIYEQVGTNAFV